MNQAIAHLNDNARADLALAEIETASAELAAISRQIEVTVNRFKLAEALLGKPVLNEPIVTLTLCKIATHAQAEKAKKCLSFIRRIEPLLAFFRFA